MIARLTPKDMAAFEIKNVQSMQIKNECVIVKTDKLRQYYPLSRIKEITAEEEEKTSTVDQILEMIKEIRRCGLYCMAEYCPGKKDCAKCSLEYIEKRITEEYK